MSQSPATPNKPSSQVGQTTGSSTQKPALGSWVNRSSLHEPSPASTYGETTAGDSIPATPQDVDGHDQGAALLDSLCAASLNDSVDRGSGSPFPARPAKSLGRAEKHSMICRDSSPQSDVSPFNKRSNSPVKADCPEPNTENPAWRKHGDFIRSSHGEDPFMVSHNQATRLASTGKSEKGISQAA
ncbi:MAG: hypothetical protein Q9216_001684 [Gyalolechia sp. 2 TL-2023]